MDADEADIDVGDGTVNMDVTVFTDFPIKLANLLLLFKFVLMLLIFGELLLKLLLV